MPSARYLHQLVTVTQCTDAFNVEQSSYCDALNKMFVRSNVAANVQALHSSSLATSFECHEQMHRKVAADEQNQSRGVPATQQCIDDR